VPASLPKSNGPARKVLYVALTCAGTHGLYRLVLALYAMSSFGARWIAEYPLVGTYGPLFASALASGTAVGVLVGILSGAGALAITAWAGLCVCILSFIAAAAAGGIAWALTNVVLITAPLIAGGLLLGGLAGRKLRHA
jgi:hypothetical protein